MKNTQAIEELKKLWDSKYPIPESWKHGDISNWWLSKLSDILAARNEKIEGLKIHKEIRPNVIPEWRIAYNEGIAAALAVLEE